MDYRSIFLNILESRRYRRWVDSLLREHSSSIDNPSILDVGCGSNKISKSKTVTGCDMFPVSDDIIQASADSLPFESASIDIIVSAHCLEHMANPIKAINEWCRVVGSKGLIWFILPHGSRTFDRLRPLTSTDHIFDDFNQRVSEDDQTHWTEFRDLTILSGQKLPSEYIDKANNNDFEYFNSKFLIHHHVWTLSSFIELILRLNLEIIYAIDLVPGRKDSFSLIVRPKHND